MITMTRKPTWLTLTAALAGAFALGGCNNRQDEQANQRDRTVAQNQQAPQSPYDSNATQGMDQGRDATRQTDQDARPGSRPMGDRVSDAVITTTVNAELAKDPSLSALKIDVDTTDGRVVLHGSAPTEIARERATTLASNVKGVVSVDNQLVVKGQG